MIRSATTASGLVLDIAGALILALLALGIMLKTPRAALEESTLQYVALDASLASQTADAQVGATLLVLGFCVQMISALGWLHESSWRWVAFGVGCAVLSSVGAYVVLVLYWRPRRILDMLAARLARSDWDAWSTFLRGYGEQLGRRWSGEPETVATYGLRLLGARRWSALTRGRAVPDVYTKPRSEIPGTREYEAAHPER